MLSTILHKPGDIRVEERPDPVILAPNNAVVRVVAACVCGSDLWGYRGIAPVDEPRSMGHEAIGVIEEVGADVTSAKQGDFVILPFSYNCGHCQECRAGVPASCQTVTFVGAPDSEGHWSEGAQSQRIRVPHAQASLFPVGLTEAEIEARGLIPHLLTLADVMCTGYHAAISASVKPGDVVAVVGDGAVGL
ncbi:MAG: alcohol dehydrogenase catalytic domain-containing protein, partial [Promicromonosporaceae bacterium]|nr:alcohol dehydrogenase catalytic domain-containing protein [Promicromonosporaceae bacterium]